MGAQTDRWMMGWRVDEKKKEEWRSARQAGMTGAASSPSSGTLMDPGFSLGLPPIFIGLFFVLFSFVFNRESYELNATQVSAPAISPHCLL